MQNRFLSSLFSIKTIGNAHGPLERSTIPALNISLNFSGEDYDMSFSLKFPGSNFIFGVRPP